jgi:hypothetical protein
MAFLALPLDVLCVELHDYVGRLAFAAIDGILPQAGWLHPAPPERKGR